jgi:hypothetical protein
LKYTDPSGWLIDDYFDRNGNFLYRDNKETDYIWIVDDYLDAITRATDKDLNIWDYAIKTSIEDATLSREAFKNIISFYDNELGSVDGKTKNAVLDVSFTSDRNTIMEAKHVPYSYFFGLFEGYNDKINTNYRDGKINSLLNTGSNIKNTLVHEYKHVYDYHNGFYRKYKQEQLELRAIDKQKQHPTYQYTTPDYKRNIEKYYENNKKKPH